MTSVADKTTVGDFPGVIRIDEDQLKGHVAEVVRQGHRCWSWACLVHQMGVFRQRHARVFAHTTPLKEQVIVSPLSRVSVGGKQNVSFTVSPSGTADVKSEAISFIWALAI
jgi:hypothetical protein